MTLTLLQSKSHLRSAFIEYLFVRRKAKFTSLKIDRLMFSKLKVLKSLKMIIQTKYNLV